MWYISTRGRAIPQSFTDILLAGTAPDRGLYMPAEYPQLNLHTLRGMSYLDVAHAVVGRFAPELRGRTLRGLIGKAYRPGVFDSPQITPLKLLEPGLYLLQLSGGPTLAFKDVPLQLLGALMEDALVKNRTDLNILGATSGDTGSAAEYAVRGRLGMQIFMLSPHGRMSRFQQRQMYTLREPYIHNLVVNGTFDDCQALFKAAFDDIDFKQKHRLGAVNSVNWARIAAQVVYYVYACLQVATRDGQQVDFAVPSGNFGNAFSAYVARRMGAPIRHIIVATNENDVLDEFFRTGTCRERVGNEVIATSSPSMDIAQASNLERLVFEALHRDGELVESLWDSIKRKGFFDAPMLTRRLADVWKSGSAQEEDVAAEIRNVYQKFGVIIDPHTAVGMHVGLRYRSPDVPLVVAETAQAAKFEDTIQTILGFKPPVPKGYEDLADLTEHTVRIDPDVGALKKYIAAYSD